MENPFSPQMIAATIVAMLTGMVIGAFIISLVYCISGERAARRIALPHQIYTLHSPPFDSSHSHLLEQQCSSSMDGTMITDADRVVSDTLEVQQFPTFAEVADELLEGHEGLWEQLELWDQLSE